MTTLFEEAIADAKKLREVAEQNAKDAIIEAMTPRIRRLIEQELVGYDAEEDEAPELDDVVSAEHEDMADDSAQTVTLDLDSMLSEPAVSDTGNGTQVNVPPGSSFILNTGDVEIDIEPEEEEEGDDLLMSLNQESARALASLIKSTKRPSGSQLYNRIKIVEKKLNRLDVILRYAGGSSKNPLLHESARKYYIQLLKEVIRLRRGVILTEGSANTKKVRSRLNRLLKEIKKMSKRHAETLFTRLFEEKSKALDEFDVNFEFEDEELETLAAVEEPEELEDELEMIFSDATFAGDEDAGGDEEVEADVEVEEEVATEALYRRLASILREQDEEDSPIEDVGDVIPVADAEAAVMDLGAALGLDVEVGEVEGEEVEVEEDEEVVEEMDDMDEVYEIDESVLRRELRRMRRLREQEEAKDADPFLDHGGEDLGDVVLDVDEEDLINALADELGDPDVATPVVERRRRRASRRRAPHRRVNESRKNAALSRKLVEYKKAVGALRGQLTEMNLFNAKLLYVNKLMQNRNLTSRQQRAIVEALDNAKTLREAKLLYKSLTTSLNKRKSLTEGRVARTLGSSSRSTRSASAAKNGNEVDRWAILAGINKK